MGQQKEELHIKYRPACMDDMAGQSEVVSSIKNMIASDRVPHVCLFTGTSGGGKTTVALILAKELEIGDDTIQIVDCATNSGADAIRDIMRASAFRPLGVGAKKMIVLDEVHGLSKQAQQSLLIDTENCPDHLYIILCTTDAHKIIKPLKTRCQEFKFNPVRYDDLVDLLDFIATEEEIKLSDSDLGIIARESEGSPRQAIVNMAKCRYAEGSDEIRSLLNTASETTEGINLCRLLVKGYSASGFTNAIAILNKMPEVAPESIRLMVINYFNKMVLGGARDVPWALSVLESFSCSTVYNQSEKMAPVLLALGELYLGEE